MATLNDQYLSLADIARTNYGSEEGGRSDVAELLAQYNPIIDDIQWVPSNGETNHKLWYRDTLPDVNWTGVNEGSSIGKATQKMATESMGLLEAISENEEKMLSVGGLENKIRWDQDKGFVEAMAQEFARTVFYGNDKVNEKQFTGLANRYNSLSGNIARQVVSGGGSGSDNTSIYIVRHGSDGLQGLYPKGMPSGLQVEDKGRHRIADPNNSAKAMFVKTTQYLWWCGLAVNNPYNIVRIANIDRSDLEGGSAANLVNLILEGLARFPIQENNQLFAVPSLGDKNKVTLKSRTTIYMNRSVALKLRKQANAITANGMVAGQAFGVPYEHICGIPTKVVDVITNTETAVS